MTGCGHNHDEMDLTLIKRLRFIKLALDTLLLPDNPNREQSYKAAMVMLQIIGVSSGNQPADNSMNGWVYAKELVEALSSNLTSDITQDEVMSFFTRVEALSEHALDGNEEKFIEQRAKLEELSVEKPVAGLLRIIVLCKRMVKHRHKFSTVDVTVPEILTSQHLINKDLADWRTMGMKPHWFNDDFLVFRDSIERRMEMTEEELAKADKKEEELIFKLFMIRHQSPEGLNLKKFYAKKIQDNVQSTQVDS